MQLFFASILVMVLFAGSLAAGEAPEAVPCEVLQYKDGRLYFSAGEEAHVYRYAGYVVVDTAETDTVLAGYIEHSWLGISASFPIDSGEISDMTERLSVSIEPAAIDSSSPIIIGTDIPDLRLFTDNLLSSRLHNRSYNHHTAMAQDLRAGVLDGCVSFKEPGSVNDGIVVTDYALPYVAMLVPNLGRSLNWRGHLATSLYYRFDHDRSGLYFEGRTIPQMCLWMTSDPVVTATHHLMRTRAYPLDPERGRQLIDNLPRSSEKIRLYVGSPDLQRLAHYFGDILARDRFPVELTGTRQTADLYLEFVRMNARIPSTAVYAVQHKLVSDTVAGAPTNEAVRISAGLADLIESADSEQDYYSYLDRMSRIQVADIGVFPLFRPKVYFSSGRTIQGVRIDEDGFLNFTEAYKVILPSPPEEAP